MALSDELPAQPELDEPSLSEGEWLHLQQQLKACDLCGRTFFEHRLAKHQQSCRPKPAKPDAPPPPPPDRRAKNPAVGRK